MKTGTVRGKPRSKCEDCGYNFTRGDGRVKESLAVKKALAVMLYSLSKTSFGMLWKIFGVSRFLTYRWIRDEADRISEPEVSGEITKTWIFITRNEVGLWGNCF